MAEDAVNVAAPQPPDEVSRAGLADDTMRFWLAFWLFISTTAVAIIGLLDHQIDPSTLRDCITLFGTFDALIVGYYWGSSSGSKLKTMQGAKE